MSWSSLDPRIREVAERVLTEEQLEVVKLRATNAPSGEPLGWRTIARQLDVDESTVRRRWERAERRLRQELAALYGLDNGP